MLQTGDAGYEESQVCGLRDGRSRKRERRRRKGNRDKLTSWNVQRLAGGVDQHLHITDVTNASRTLLMNLTTLQWDLRLSTFFEIRPSGAPCSRRSVLLPKCTGVKIAGLAGDQQAALIGNKCLKQGEAKCTYGTGAFLLFCTGEDIVLSQHGLLSTVAYQDGPKGKPMYALEGSIAVAGSAIKWLRDTMILVSTAGEGNTLAQSVPDTGGVYFVTAFSGLLAPYWDPGTAGLLIGLSSYTTPAHIALATLEANAFQTRAILESMKLDSNTDLKHLKVDGVMTNGDMVMKVLANIGVLWICVLIAAPLFYDYAVLFVPMENFQRSNVRKKKKGRRVTRVYAVNLDDECVDRWGEILYDEVYPGKRERVSPEDFRDALDRMQTLTVNYIAHRIYCEFPNVPILRRASLFTRCPRLSWLFVFKDNSSREALDALLNPEDVIGVKKFIGVEKQGAKWYHVDHEDD
ncbi:FGGY family of carbohydrate kinase [Fomes fomentarius]|nr:FGGY family of carbohydrate kinase [Fomes fomentarius]